VVDCVTVIAGAADLEGLTGLVDRAMDAGWGRSRIETALQGPLSRARIARSASGEDVGFVLARRIEDGLEIDLVGVLPEWRRRGVAAALLSGLLAEERVRGLAEARLELAELNAAAQALYAQLGFVVVGRRSRYYPDGDDALLLTRTW